VLSAIAHGHGSVETVLKVALAAITAARELDRDRFLPYSGLILAALSEAGRKALAMHKPSAEQVCTALEDAIAKATRPPKYMITDQGVQFRDAYRAWCDKHRVKPRFGAVGKTASLAVVERVHRTIKSEGLRRILLPLRAEDMLVEVELVVRWYNELRPHRRFDGATPAEIKADTLPATKGPRFETRATYPVTADLRAERGVVLELDVTYLEHRRHLPIVGLKRAA
jgi:hypothetical protein